MLLIIALTQIVQIWNVSYYYGCNVLSTEKYPAEYSQSVLAKIDGVYDSGYVKRGQ